MLVLCCGVTTLEAEIQCVAGIEQVFPGKSVHLSADQLLPLEMKHELVPLVVAS